MRVEQSDRLVVAPGEFTRVLFVKVTYAVFYECGGFVAAVLRQVVPRHPEMRFVRPFLKRQPAVLERLHKNLVAYRSKASTNGKTAQNIHRVTDAECKEQTNVQTALEQI